MKRPFFAAALAIGISGCAHKPTDPSDFRVKQLLLDDPTINVWEVREFEGILYLVQGFGGSVEVNLDTDLCDMPYQSGSELDVSVRFRVPSRFCADSKTTEVEERLELLTLAVESTRRALEPSRYVGRGRAYRVDVEVIPPDSNVLHSAPLDVDNQSVSLNAIVEYPIDAKLDERMAHAVEFSKVLAHELFHLHERFVYAGHEESLAEQLKSELSGWCASLHFLDMAKQQTDMAAPEFSIDLPPEWNLTLPVTAPEQIAAAMQPYFEGQVLAANASASFIAPLIVYRMSTDDDGLELLARTPSSIRADSELTRKVCAAVSESLTREGLTTQDLWDLALTEASP